MLFGHQNDDATRPAQTGSDAVASNVNPLAVDPATGASLPVAPADPPLPPEPDEPSVLNQPTTSPSEDTVSSTTDMTFPALDDTASAPVVPTAVTEPSPASLPMDLSSPTTNPTDDNTTAPAIEQPEPQTPAPLEPEIPAEPALMSEPVASPEPAPMFDSISSDNLLELKQQALTQLEPLVDKLDQTPEEKFRTTMMLIQSTDNPTLIQDAYDAAQAIGDEKVRAQALLDVINEINYFTQQAPKA